MSEFSVQGVYAIKNKANGKMYVGSAATTWDRGSIHFRYKRHLYHLQKGDHHSRHLQNAWNKYGSVNFELLVLEEVKNVKDLLVREDYWIAKYRAAEEEFGYNICPYATRTEGCKWSEESKNKVRGENHHFFGKHHTEETKKKCGETNVGNKYRKGKLHTAEVKERMSETRTGMYIGELNPFYGKEHNEETKKRCGIQNIGKQRRLGIKHTEETKIKMKSTKPRGSSGFKGVTLVKGKWRSKIYIDGKPTLLGDFIDVQEAARNFDFYSLKYFGEQCYLNFPELDYSDFAPKKIL